MIIDTPTDGEYVHGEKLKVYICPSWRLLFFLGFIRTSNHPA